MSVRERIGSLQERLSDRLGRTFGACAVCGKPTRSHRVGSRLQCHTCHEAGRFPVATDGGHDVGDVRERVEQYVDVHPDAGAVEIVAQLGLDPSERDRVEEILHDDESDRPVCRPDRFDVPVDDQCALPQCHNERVNNHPDSLCAEHWHDGDPSGQATIVDDEDTTTDGGRDRPPAEARAVAGLDAPNDDVAVDGVDPGDSTADDDPDESEWSLADAMGDTDGLADPDPDGTASTPDSSGGGTAIGMPTSALPLGQLDALDPSERRRAARQRGLSWPTTDDARDRLFDTITEVMRHEDDRVVDAPTALGKTHTVAATRWGAREDVTGGRPVVHLLETQAARDEAWEIAQEHHSEDPLILLSKREACDVARGAYDPSTVADDPETEPLTVDGQPASEYIAELCENRGVHFSRAHRAVEQRNDQGRPLPCCEDGQCRALEQWEEFREEDHSLVVATHNFAYAPGLRMHNNIVIDEEPDYTQDLSTDRVRRAVTAYLQTIDATVQTWEALVQLSLHEGSGDDAANERDALEQDLRQLPDPEWYIDEPDAHTLAPALARAVFHAEARRNGRRFGKTLYEPPRLDGGARDDDDWNREWVSVVLDESNDVRTVRAVPDFGAARSVIGLDAHPALPNWQVNTVPWIQDRSVLDADERRLWRRYERGLRVVQVGDATRPLTGGEYFDYDGTRAIVDGLHDKYGQAFRTAITASAVEDRLASIMDHVDIHSVETMHYGEEKSRNDFAHEDVGLVNGVIDPGDGYVLDLLAELELDAEPVHVDCDHCSGDGTCDGDCHLPRCPPTDDDCGACDGSGAQREKGRTFEGADAETAREILASVRENHVAQAAGRYARNPDRRDDTATVFVRTDAMPAGFADVQVPGTVWTYGDKQDRIVEVLREAESFLTAREIADRADCSKRHVQQTLSKEYLAEHVQTCPDGPHGATLYAEDGVPNAGVVDLGADHELSRMRSTSTAGFAIRDPSGEDGESEGTAADDSSVPAPFWEPPAGTDTGGTG